MSPVSQESQNFSEVLIDAFYNNPQQPNWGVLAEQTGLSREDCQKQWLALSGLSQTLAKIEMREPSQMVINRLLALARDDVQKVSFWQKFMPYRMALSFGVVLFVATMAMQNGLWSLHKPAQTKVANATKTLTKNQILNEAVKNRMLKTTLDEFEGKVHRKNLGQFSLAKPVSVGTGSYSFDSDNDDDLFKTDLKSQEIESLFFRARKFEKQGYFREALKDYQFLAQFYPAFMQPQTLHIAMARCLEGLGQEQDAIELLQKSSARYGESQDLRTMLDQLKSQTF